MWIPTSCMFLRLSLVVKFDVCLHIVLILSNILLGVWSNFLLWAQSGGPLLAVTCLYKWYIVKQWAAILIDLVWGQKIKTSIVVNKEFKAASHGSSVERPLCSSVDIVYLHCQFVGFTTQTQPQHNLNLNWSWVWHEPI